MKKKIRLLFLIVLMLTAFSASALADTASLSGTVTASRTCEIYAASSGTINSVSVTPGQTVAAGDTIATLRTTEVRAEVDGKISAMFAEVGDLTDTLTTRYGAAAYIESDVLYTVSASSSSAYSSVSMHMVHAGDKVYLRGRNETTRVGVGTITSIDNTTFNVNVTEGGFLLGESVNVYRGEDYSEATRVGRGTVARGAPVAVTGTGRIVSVAVKAGDKVQRGDLIMETITGSSASDTITTDVSGIVAQLNVTQGAAVEENAVVAVVWPSDAMQIAAKVEESNLQYVNVGGEVSLTFEWNSDSGKTAKGTVRAISAVPDADSESTVYTAYIDFTPDAYVRYGMNVTVETR